MGDGTEDDASRPRRRTETGSARSRALFRWAVTIAVAPITVTAVYMAMAGWTPTGDAALTTIWINDVFSARPPLIGLPAAPALETGFSYSFPGALELYLLAVPVRLLGDVWGLLLGAAAINTTACVVALWLVRRRVGYAGGLVGCAFVASVLWAMGAAVLVASVPMLMGEVPFILFLVAAWSVACGDGPSLPIFAMTANYLFLCQLKFAAVVPLVGLVVLALWLRRLAERRRADPMEWRRTRRLHGRWFVVSALLTFVVWIPPLVDQFFTSHGNLAELVRGAGSLSSAANGGAHRTLLRAAAVVVSPITTWPLWSRPSFENPNFDGFGITTSSGIAIISLLVVLLVVTRLALGAFRRRDVTVLTGFMVGAVATVAWVISAYVNPATFTKYSRSYLAPLWPLSAFIWMMITFAVLRSERATSLLTRGSLRGSAIVAVCVAVVLLSVLATPITDRDVVSRDLLIVPARDLRRAIGERVSKGGPILVRSQTSPMAPADAPNLDALFPVALLQLQESGIEFRVEGAENILYFRHHRAFSDHSPDVSRELALSSSPLDLPGAELIVHLEVDRGTESAEVGRKFRAWTAALARRSSATSTDQTRFPQNFRRCLTTENDEGVAVADSYSCVLGLLFRDDEAFASFVTIPSVDPKDARAWLFDRLVELTLSGWVYEVPCPSTARTIGTCPR